MKHALSRITATTVAVLLTMGVSGSAHAADNPGKLLVIGSTSQNSLHFPASKSPSAVGSGVVPLVTGSGGSITAEKDVVVPTSGSGTFATGFSSSYTQGGATPHWVNIAGSSWAYWLGSTPYNADQVSLSDSWWISGLGVSVSIPGGVGFSTSNDTATFSNTVLNNWRNDHNFSGIDFSAALFVSGPYESATSSMTIGSTTTITKIS